MSDELSFSPGDVITLTEAVDDSWLRGTLKGTPAESDQ